MLSTTTLRNSRENSNGLTTSICQCGLQAFICSGCFYRAFTWKFFLSFRLPRRLSGALIPSTLASSLPASLLDRLAPRGPCSRSRHFSCLGLDSFDRLWSRAERNREGSTASLLPSSAGRSELFDCFYRRCSCHLNCGPHVSDAFCVHFRQACCVLRSLSGGRSSCTLEWGGCRLRHLVLGRLNGLQLNLIGVCLSTHLH
mmetsp:Transcript_9817/g.17635  ORF Transcript_9817/g.17635 Transcript_9817/m.17635 type:complete len:200 (+) Transcript_9817:519-1118(+)